jgi:hypothetical protein
MEAPRSDLLRRAAGSGGRAYDKLADYYRDDPHVEVIIDRRAQGGKPGEHPPFEDRRRQRPKGSFPKIEPPA